MTAWFRTSRRAEDFSARIEGSLPGAHRKVDAETERLETVVRGLRAQGSVSSSAAPREDFARDLRERLMAEAPSVLTAEIADNNESSMPTAPLRKAGTREKRLVAAATAAVVLGGGVGVATASQNSLPGDTLYPIKRIVERADVLLSGSPAARGRDLLHQATGRLDEAQGLLAEDHGTSTALVPGTLQAFTVQGREGGNLLLGDYRDNPAPASVLTVRRFAAASLRSLNALLATAPAEARPAIRDAESMLAEIDEHASALCPTCADLPDLRLLPTFQASAEVTRVRAEVNAAKLEHSRPAVADVPDPKTVKAAAASAGTAAPARAHASVPADAPAPASALESRPARPQAPAPETVLPPPIHRVAPRTTAPLAVPSAAPSIAPVEAPSVTTVLKVPTVTKAPAAADNPLPKRLESQVASPDVPAVRNPVKAGVKDPVKDRVKDKVDAVVPQRRADLPKTVLPGVDGSLGQLGQ